MLTVFSFAAVELFFIYICRIDMRHFTKFQMKFINRYKYLMLEMADYGYGIASKWSPLTKLIINISIQSIIFVVCKLIMSSEAFNSGGNKIGEYFMDLVHDYIDNNDNQGDKAEFKHENRIGEMVDMVGGIKKEGFLSTAKKAAAMVLNSDE